MIGKPNTTKEFHLNNSWYRVVLPRTERSLSLGLQLISMAERMHEQLGRPGGFAVFIGVDAADDEDRNLIELYFSPVAAMHCMESLASLDVSRCERPKRDGPGFGLVYGEGSSAWDLLD